MASCNQMRTLRLEIQRVTDMLLDLFLRKHSAFALGHENTLRVLDQQISRLFTEKDLIVHAVERY
jgi:hypothetical protein